jgi:hypothetical protein
MKEIGKMIMVEVELDGVICSKRVPAEIFTLANNRESVRRYFSELGYKVGQCVRFI